MGAKILASWFSTIFYQLECEAYGNNRKGLRKLEEKDYEPFNSMLKLVQKYEGLRIYALD